MPISEVTVLRICGKCHLELETFTVKKDNLRLFSDQLVWCPNCQADTHEVRDLAGRGAAIHQEQGSYAANNPVDPETRR